MVALTAIRSLPRLKDNEMYMIADSGANHHYIPTKIHRCYMLCIEESRNDIGGLTGPGQAATTHLGLFAAQVDDDCRHSHDMTSVAFAVDGAEVRLFSKVQACFAGNTVVHSGPSYTGRHRLILKGTNTFIPYIFDSESRLWYIKVREATQAHCFTARKLDQQDEL